MKILRDICFPNSFAACIFSTCVQWVKTIRVGGSCWTNLNTGQTGN